MICSHQSVLALTELAVGAEEARVADTLEGVDAVQTHAVAAARRVDAVVHCCESTTASVCEDTQTSKPSPTFLAGRPGERRQTCAREAVDAVQTCATIFACVGNAVVHVCQSHKNDNVV
jgi:hypothetical protein